MRIWGALAFVVVVAISSVVSGCSSGSGPVPLPGGTSGKDVLQAHHLLDAKGRVAPGLTEPEGKTVKAAICDYVFGTPDEVGATAKLDGTVTLWKDSGYLYAGGGGSGVSCTYQVGGKSQFELVIWDEKSTAHGGATHMVTVDLPNGFYGASAYAPGYHGKAIAESDAKRWLHEAAGRVTHGSI